jgi:hypothetical protein
VQPLVALSGAAITGGRMRNPLINLFTRIIICISLSTVIGGIFLQGYFYDPITLTGKFQIDSVGQNL